MLRVKLRCGERAVIMAYTSMADVLTTASDRLGCQARDVILKMNIEGDDEPWEIEGEAMLQSAVEDGHVISAFIASAARPPPKKRARTDADRAGPSSLHPTTARVLQSGMVPVQRSAASAPARPSTSSAKSNPYLSSGGESADEGKTNSSTQRSSKRKWTEKEDKFLWSSLDVELKALPSPNPVYTRDERRTVFESIMQKHSRRFVGRTAEALRSRVRSKVLEQRKENKKLPARINALFPVSRSWSTAPIAKAPQPDSVTAAGTKSIVRPLANANRNATNLAAQPTIPSASSSSHRASSAPVPLRRTFVADVIRLRAIENAANGSQATQSTNSSSNSSSDEGEEGVQAGPSNAVRAASSDANSPLTPSPGPNIEAAGRGIRIKTEEPDEPQIPALRSHVTALSTQSRASRTGQPNQAVVKAERTFVFCAPAFRPPNDEIARAEPGIRAQTREALFDSPDKVLLDDSVKVDLNDWAAGIVNNCMQTCSNLDSINDSLASAEHVSYVVYVVLDESFRQNFALNREKCSNRKLACAMALTFNALRTRFKIYEGFDLLFCRMLRHTLFKADVQGAYASMYVAAFVLLIDVQSYESILDGIFSVPWTKTLDGRNASSISRLDDQSSMHIFVRMAAFVDSLESMANFVVSHPLANTLFRQLHRAPKFKANAWQRIFKETSTEAHASWPDRQIVERVRSGMLEWNAAIVKSWSSDNIHLVRAPSARSVDSPPARNTRSNTTAFLADGFPPPSQQPLFRGLPDLSQGGEHRR
jgi:hypothetical protein